ncbi:MAG: ATP synthase subunit I [bacterium]
MGRINNVEKTVLSLSLLFLGAGLILFSLLGRWPLLGGFLAGGAIVIAAFAWSSRDLRFFLGAVPASPEGAKKSLGKFRFRLFFRLGITMVFVSSALAAGADFPGLILGICAIPASLMGLALICLLGYLRFGGVEIGSC